MRDLDWDDLRFVLAVARQRSFAAAARLLQVNESTVSRRIAKSEARLQAQLFERSDGRLFPTAAGQELVGHAEKIELEVQAAAEAISGTDIAVAGRVRITSVPLIVNQLLAPSLPDFLRRHPHLHIDLIAESADLSLLHREADIALRLARPQRETRALTRRIGDIDYGVYAARDRASESRAWITYTKAMSFLPQHHWITEQSAGQASMLSTLRVSDAETLLQAVKAGCGQSYLPVFLAEADPCLRRVDDGTIVRSREVWMMIHPELKDLVRMRTTIDWLTAVFQQRLRDAPE